MPVSEKVAQLLSHVPAFGEIVSYAGIDMGKLGFSPECKNVRFHPERSSSRVFRAANSMSPVIVTCRGLEEEVNRVYILEPAYYAIIILRAPLNDIIDVGIERLQH